MNINKGVVRINKNVEDKEPIIVIKKASYDLPCENILFAGFEDIIVSGESGIEKNVKGIVLKKEFEIDKVIINVNKSIKSWLINNFKAIIVTKFMCKEGTIPVIRPVTIPKNIDIKVSIMN